MKRKFKNRKPISDIGKVLGLLVGEFGDKTQRRLRTPANELPFIQVEHYGGQYDEIFAIDYYSVTAAVVEELRRKENIVNKHVSPPL